MRQIVALLLCACIVSACAAPIPTHEGGTIRVGFTNQPDLSDMPSLLAHELLRAQGYTVETQFFAGAEVAVAAMAQNALDFGNGSTQLHWSAISKGAPLITIAEEAANVWSLVARAEIQKCGDLNGKRLGVASLGSVTTVMTRVHLREHCAAAAPEYVITSNSANRAAALMAGELDATALGVIDVMNLMPQGGTQFHTLANYAESLPQLETTAVHVRREFAREHPDAVRDYLKALLTVHRQLRENPQALQDTALEHLKLSPADAERFVKLYLQKNIWDMNGGLTRDGVAYSVSFFVQAGSLPPELTADHVSDLSYLDAVLNEIGRK
jgi:NitT/TauT family transport system substrate-binding protein